MCRDGKWHVKGTRPDGQRGRVDEAPAGSRAGEGAWPRAAPPPPPSRPAPHSTPGTPSRAAPSATLPTLPMLPMLPGRCPLGGLCGDLAPEARGSPQASLSVPVPVPGHVAGAHVRRDGFPALRPLPPPRQPVSSVPTAEPGSGSSAARVLVTCVPAGRPQHEPRGQLSLAGTVCWRGALRVWESPLVRSRLQ